MFANRPNLFRIGVIAVVVWTIMAMITPPVAAQDDWSAEYISLDNQYIGFALGTAGKLKNPDPPYGHHLQDNEPVGGRWLIWTTGGDPSTTLDDNFPLIYTESASGMLVPGDKWAAFQLMIGGFTASQSSQTPAAPAWAYFERGVTSAIMGDWKDGGWTVWPYKPTNKANTIIGTWYPDFTKGTPAVADPANMDYFPVRCDLEAKLMRDTVRFKWTITNEDAVDHLIGIRSYADVTPSPWDDGTLDMHNIISIPGRPLITDETLIPGNELPATVDMYDSQQNPHMGLRFIVKGQGATPPDMVGIDDWAVVADPYWTYWHGTPTSGGDPMLVWHYEPLPFSPIYDVGYGAFWKPRRVVPGGSVTYITYAGLASATSDFTKPNLNYPQYVAAVQGPKALKYTNEASGSVGVGQLYPSPFTIHAWMYNTEKSIDLQNPSFTLTLPSGLVLDDTEGGKYSKSLASVPANSEGHVSWKVRPVGQPTGILDYTVSMSTTPVGGTTVRRSINVPATEVQPFAAGWQMISVPFELSNGDPQTALGLTNAVLWRYDTYSRQYKTPTTLVPGEAYWLKITTGQTGSLAPGQFNAINWTTNQGYQIPLQVGWNLVGNPYVYSYTLGETKFYHVDYGTMTYDEAMKRGLISNTVFWWDPMFRQYKWSSDRSVQFKPWQGYWLRALRSGITMTVSPASQIGASVGGEPTSDDTGGGSGGGGGPEPPPSP